MTYNTLQESMKTNLPPIIISVEDYTHKGEKRQWIKARKARGKMVYRVALYANGQYSEAV
jgi:hypothetical protein